MWFVVYGNKELNKLQKQEPTLTLPVECCMVEVYYSAEEYFCFLWAHSGGHNTCVIAGMYLGVTGAPRCWKRLRSVPGTLQSGRTWTLQSVDTIEGDYHTHTRKTCLAMIKHMTASRLCYQIFNLECKQNTKTAPRSWIKDKSRDRLTRDADFTGNSFLVKTVI